MRNNLIKSDKLRRILSIFPYYIILYILIPIIISLIISYYFEQRALRSTILEVEQISTSKYQLQKDIKEKDDIEKKLYTTYIDVPEEFGITIDGKPYYNVIISYWILKNIGRNPIKESDFSIPISITTHKGAKFLVVKIISSNNKFLIKKWNINSEKTSAELEPLLLNPDDWLKICVAYQFNPDDQETKKLQWQARISGLRKMNVRDIYSKYKEVYHGFFSVYIFFQNIEIFILIVIILLLFSFGVFLAERKDKLHLHSFSEYLILIFIMFFSMTTGEMITNLIFNEKLAGWQYAIPLLIGYILLLLFLIDFPKLRIRHK